MPPATNKHKLHQTLLREWLAAVDRGDFERAIGIDNLHYNELVKKNEDVAFWDRWQTDTLACRRRLTARIEGLCPPVSLDNSTDRPCLIVYHNYSGLAHETQFARNMAWLRRHDMPIRVEIAYLFGSDQHRPLGARLFGVSPEAVHFLQANNYQQAADRLSVLSARLDAQAIVYPSLFIVAFWMSLFVPHPNQKFVQMKYYPQHAGRIRGWFGGYRNNGTHYRIHGCDFEQLPVLDLQLAKHPYPELSTTVEGQPVTIGSISRPEKLTDGQYNRFVLDVLARHERLHYLYTGQPETLALIPDPVRRHERSTGLGWVDPVSAIQQFDIYLEPFPWGGGDMSLLALEAGRAYLTLSSPENVRFGIYSLIKYIADQGDPLLQYSFCKNMIQLRQRSDELVADHSLRQRLGQAWKKAVQHYKAPASDSWQRLFNE